MKKMKNYFTAYRIATILFTLFTVLYWFDYNISPELKWSTFLVLGFFALPVKVLFEKFFSRPAFSETLSYIILTNVTSIILFSVIRIKKQGVSVTNLFNTTSLFVLLTIWFNQLNYEFSFINDLLIKGFITGMFGTLLVFLNSVNHSTHMVRTIEKEQEQEQGIATKPFKKDETPIKEEKLSTPNIREGLQ